MNARPSILVVDDDQQIGELLGEFLGREGFQVTSVGDGLAMREALARGAVDLVVLDRMLPGENGLELLAHLRTNTQLPVILLTAMGEEADRVAGLDKGADDYLTKPFSPRELLARVRAVLRRAVPQELAAVSDNPDHAPPPIYEFAGWRLDAARRDLHSPEGVLVELTSGEFDILNAFLLHPHEVLNRDQLLELARGRVAGPMDRTIDVQVGRLRRKLEADPKNPEMLKTVRGGGYVLTASVAKVDRT